MAGKYINVSEMITVRMRNCRIICIEIRHCNIYLSCHLKTDWFVASQLFRVARNAMCFKLGSKHGLLYDSRTSYPHNLSSLSAKAREFFRICLFTYTLIIYRSGQFMRRPLHLGVCGCQQFLTWVLNLRGWGVYIHGSNWDVTLNWSACEYPPKACKNDWKNWKLDKEVEIIHPTGLLRSARIYRRLLETWGNLPFFRY